MLRITAFVSIGGVRFGFLSKIFFFIGFNLRKVSIVSLCTMRKIHVLKMTGAVMALSGREVGEAS